MQQSANGKQAGRFLLVIRHGKFLVLSLMLGFFFFLSLCNDDGGCSIPGGFGGEDLSLVAAAFSGIRTGAAPEVIRRLQHVSLSSTGSGGMLGLLWRYSVHQGRAAALQGCTTKPACLVAAPADWQADTGFPQQS